MNYRHIYHAGNPADVVKHALLVHIIRAMQLKAAAYFYLDTHAGIADYDTQAEAAQKTEEAQAGIGKILNHPNLPYALTDYAAVIKGYDTEGRHYPGSPRVARLLARPQDRLALCELHPEDVHTLRRGFYNDPQAAVHHRDGYEALKALLPPEEKRGLILIDPPFEKTTEFADMTVAVKAALGRFPSGCYMLWFPIKKRFDVEQFYRDAVTAGFPKTLALEVMFRPDDTPEGLNGTGLLIVNPPFAAIAGIPPILDALGSIYSGQGGYTRHFWLVEEK